MVIKLKPKDQRKPMRRRPWEYPKDAVKNIAAQIVWEMTRSELLTRSNKIYEDAARKALAKAMCETHKVYKLEEENKKLRDLLSIAWDRLGMRRR